MLGTHEAMGTMIEVITSFNQRYYDLIGRDSVASWLRHWPADMRLTCYVEDFEMPTNPRINIVGWKELSGDFFDLQRDFPDTSIVKFAKKGYSLIHALYHSTADWVLWLDADVITQKDINHAVLDEILPVDCLATYMGVTYQQDKQGRTGDWLVPETGIFAINLRHPGFSKFRDEYHRRYRERDQTGLRRFYDNDVLGAAILAVPAIYNDLCKDFSKPSKTPLPRISLGQYLHHYKAKHSKKDYANQ